MRHRPSHLVALVAILVLALGTTAGADAELVADDLQLFQRNEARGDAPCGPGADFNLGLEAGAGEAGCGFVGGLPFGEVFAQTGDTDTFLDTFSTRATEVEPFVLDASRDVTGQISIVPSLAGAGQIAVDLRLTVRAAVGNATTVLGTTTVEGIAAGPDPVRLPYTFDVPAAADGKAFRAASLEVYVRGIHANHGYNELNGQSFVTLPVLVPAP
jgi:hypothetical protein